MFSRFFQNNKEYFGIVICLLLLIVVMLASLSQSQQPSCYSQLAAPSTFSSWEIFPPNTTAEIIWQKSEDIPRREAFTGSANSDLTVSAQHVVYNWIPYEPACDVESGSLLMAFDLESGAEAWRFGQYMSNFGRIIAVNDGYVFISGAGDTVTKLDDNGQFVWQNNQFPSRSISNIFANQHELYLPSSSRVYHLVSNRGTGGIVETLEIPNVVGYFGEYGLVRMDENQMSVIDGATLSSLYSVQLADPTGMNLTWSTSWETFSFLYENTLLLTNGSTTPTRIDAYNIENGALLWSLTENFYTFPIAQNNFLITYGENGLRIFNLENGELVEQITFKRMADENIDTAPVNHVSLAGYGDVVSLYFRDTWELVTLRISFSEINANAG